MPAEIVLPGHGEPITDHAELIDSRFAGHERRKEKIYRLIAERPRTGYELAQALWGNVAVTQAFLTLSEVIGHADLLVNEGRVREAEDGARDPLRGELTAQSCWPRKRPRAAAARPRTMLSDDVGNRDPPFAGLVDPLRLHHPGREGGVGADRTGAEQQARVALDARPPPADRAGRRR